MALTSLHKSHQIFLNLSFILLIAIFLFFSLVPSPNQSISLSFISNRSSPTIPTDCRGIEVLEDSKIKCSYLKINRHCRTRGYFDYLHLFYCVFGNRPVFGYFILFLWLLILFYLLGNTASQYFCPSLEGLSSVLNLSPTIAGVTLLSLGNGAPDVFASIVSFGAGGEVGLSSVLGGAFFVSSAVVGVISIYIGGNSRRRDVAIDGFGFIRDLCCFLVILCFLLLILIIGKIHILGSIFYVCLYILYVFIVSTVYCHKKELETPLLESVEVEQLQPVAETHQSKQIEAKLSFLTPKTTSSWLLFLLELPLFLPRRLTIPVVAEERWSKSFAVASVIISPILLATLWNSQTGGIGSEQSITIFLFAALFGMILGFAAMEGTEASHPPKLLLPWLVGGFLMSMVWSYMVAGELVSLLVSFGHIIGASPSVLGATVLAWGNSLGDLIANVAIAVNGGEDGAQIAIAGCYAGPIFNILVGLGMSFVMSSLDSYPESFVIPEDPSKFLIIGFLTGGLFWALIMLPRKGMKLDRSLGVGLLTIYFCFICLRLLESIDVLNLGAS